MSLPNPLVPPLVRVILSTLVVLIAPGAAIAQGATETDETPPTPPVAAIPGIQEQAIELYQEGRTQQALEQLQAARRADPERARTHYMLGVASLRRAEEVGLLKVRQHLSRAINHFEKTIELAPDHVAAHYYLIQIMVNAPQLVGGDEARARELNQTLSTLSPLHHGVIRALFAREAGDYQRAEELLLALHGKHPDHSIVLLSLAQLYMDMGDFDQAIHYGIQFLAAPKSWDDKNNVTGLQLLARAYAGKGQPQQSQYYYQRAINQTHNDKLAANLREELAELSAPTSSTTSNGSSPN